MSKKEEMVAIEFTQDQWKIIHEILALKHEDCGFPPEAYDSEYICWVCQDWKRDRELSKMRKQFMEEIQEMFGLFWAI